MKKWLYDRMVTEYSKLTKEELVQKIMSLEEIEVSDRCFANECEAGTAIYTINLLFSAISELRTNLINSQTAPDELKEYLDNLFEITDNAKNEWNYIKCGLSEINDDSRCGKIEDQFKDRVEKAKNNNDSI